MSIWGKPILLTPTGAASGSLLSLPDGDGSDFLKLSIELPITQAGSGDPSTTNIRPITGWTSSKLSHRGKNLLDISILLNASGWTEDDGVYTGGNRELYDVFRFNRALCALPIGTEKAVLSFDSKGSQASNLYLGFTYWNTTTRNSVLTKGTSWAHYALASDSELFPSGCYASYYSNGTSSLRNMQVEFGDSETAYEPYVGTDYDYDWSSQAGAIAGGTLDVLTGVLTVTQIFYQFDGTESWVSSSSGANRFYRYVGYGIKTTSSLSRACSHYPNASITSGSTTVGYYAYTTSGGENAWLNFRPNLTDIPDVTSWKSFLAAQATANTPVTCYFTPSAADRPTYQLTAHQVATLVGRNNLWVDNGTLSVKYQKQAMLFMS